MINVSDAVKNAYIEGNALTDIFLTIGDEEYSPRNILSGSVSITESLCSAESFSLSRVEKNELVFTLINIKDNIKNLQGKEVTAKQTITVNGADTDIPLGVYTVVEAVNDGDYLIKCTCFDKATLKLDEYIDDWWNTQVTFPITIRNLVIALFTHLGISYDIPQEFNNYDYSVETRNAFFDGVTGAEMLGYIQEVVGGFFKADRLGVVRLYSSILAGDGLYPHIGLYPYTGLYPRNQHTSFGNEDTSGNHEYEYRQIVGDLTIADYYTSKIERVQLRGTEDDIGIIVGDGSNTYVIEGNPLLYNLTDASGRPIATNILNAIKDFRYIPFSGKFMGLPFMEVGDYVNIHTMNGHVAMSPLLCRVLSGSRLCFDTLSANGTQEIEQTTEVNRMVNVLNQRTHEIVNDVETLSSTITNVETEVAGLETITTTHTTQIAQNSNEINLVAGRNGVYNLLINSDFTDQTNRARYWTPTNISSADYFYDSNFVVSGKEDGHCMKLSVDGTETSATFHQQLLYSGTISEMVQLLMSYRFVTYDGTATLKLAVRVVDDTDTEIYFTKSSALEIDAGGDVQFARVKFGSDFITAVTNHTIKQLSFYICLDGITGTNVFEINHCFMTFETEGNLPLGTWTNISTRDLISQINLAPTGLRINANKITVDTSSLDLTFGSAQSSVTIKATDQDDGVFFDGDGRVLFETEGEFRVTNMDSNSVWENELEISHNDTRSQVRLANRWDGKSRNFIYEYASATTGYVQIYNRDSNASNMNFLFLEHYPSSNWNRILLQNNWVSGEKANWIQCSNANTTSDFQFYNYNTSGGTANRFYLTSTTSANYVAVENFDTSGNRRNYINLNSLDTNTQNYVYLANCHNNGNLANTIYMHSENNSGALSITNRDSNGATRSSFYMSADGSLSISTSTGGTSTIRVNTNGNLDLIGNNVTYIGTTSSNGYVSLKTRGVQYDYLYYDGSGYLRGANF